MRVCKVQRCVTPSGGRMRRATSSSTGNPIPPTTTPTTSGTTIHASVANVTTLSGYSANPALLNAITEWKTPR